MNDEKEVEPDAEQEPENTPGESGVTDEDELNDDKATAIATKSPSLLRNYISFVGLAIAMAGLVSLTLLFLLELTGSSDQPYLGILIYVLFPGVFITGMFIAAIGMLFERRRRRRAPEAQIAEYPIIDLNDPRRRRTLIVFLSFAFIFLFASAFGSYQAYEFTESVTFCGQVCHTVMKPEFLSYGAAPHAKVNCVECHVGGGAEWYARSKFSGVRQLVKVTFGTYDTPIQTPVHNMRPARDTCAKCHWPEKYHGEKLRVFDYFGEDEDSSQRQVRMLVKVGGGSPKTGQVSGIHWHMNLANEITYIATDEKRQNIPWVRLKDPSGKITEYTLRDAGLTPQTIAKAEKKTMDCIDCHSRPSHIYLSPNKAVDQSILANKLDRSLPFVKKKAVELLSKQYATTEEALNSISAEFGEYYRANYPDVFSAKRGSINRAGAELQRIYQTYFFPEMKTNWQTHINNIGHFNTQGCFRCHDGRHFSKEGKVIRNECNICHLTIDQTFAGVTTQPKEGRFEHPVNLGTRGNWECASCHKGDRSFKHPVNLGDISKFNCIECHKEGKF